MTETTVERALDPTQAEEFMGRVVGDLAGFFVTLLGAIGDRYGLFSELAANGPATSSLLAERSGCDERYVREWLGAMLAAGYVEYAPGSGSFGLPAAHAAVLADEGGPMFLGGVQYELLGLMEVIPRVADAFRDGGGAHHTAYGPEWWHGMERFTAGWFENLLLEQWIPALPDVERMLAAGARVADVGCGAGRAVVKLAQAFPRSRFVGYDLSAAQIERATANAAAAGVADRARFEVRNGATVLEGEYDVITTFDVVHDAADPVGLLAAIRRALAPDGSYVCLEWNGSDRIEENVGPFSALLQGFSVFYCLTTSLADDGAGLGTLGLTESKLSELAHEVGFQSFRRVELDNPFNNLYELRP